MILVENKKARLRFEVLEKFDAGMELLGHEVKSLRAKQGSLEGARVIVRGGEAYLVGLHVPPYQASNTPADYDPTRTRRLLLKSKEIVELGDAEARKGLTIVPLEVYTTKRLLKLRLAIVRGKTKVDRREDLKKADALREAQRELKGNGGLK